MHFIAACHGFPAEFQLHCRQRVLKLPAAGGTARALFTGSAFQSQPRYSPDGSRLEFLQNTTNNTWGLGFTEEFDVVGSTALWERNERAMPAVLARHDEIVHGAVGDAGGKIFKHTGDGMIAVFDDPEPAIAGARSACDGLAAESWSIPGQVKIRASLHAGPATERDGDFFGPALNRVARINGVAHPDQIVASDLVHQLLDEPVGLDLGEHQLRDLGEPIRLWQLDDGEHPVLASLQADLHNLPVQLNEFVGRTTELGQLAMLLTEHRLVRCDRRPRT